MRHKVISRAATFEDLMNAAKTYFFPNGKNPKQGKLLAVTNYYLADFSLTKISKEDVNLEIHISTNGLKRFKFSLTTKDFSFHDYMYNNQVEDDEILSSDDDFLSMVNNKYSTGVLQRLLQVYKYSLQASRALKAEQDEAFSHSLQADKEKDKVCHYKPTKRKIRYAWLFSL